MPGETACFECRKMQAQDSTPWYRRLTDYGRTVVDRRGINPCTSPVAGIIGNIAALEVVKYLTGLSRPAIYDRRLNIDLRTFESWTNEGERQADCPVCSGVTAGQERPAWATTT